MVRELSGLFHLLRNKNNKSRNGLQQIEGLLTELHNKRITKPIREINKSEPASNNDDVVSITSHGPFSPQSYVVDFYDAFR
jgi:hypothetical protein